MVTLTRHQNDLLLPKHNGKSQASQWGSLVPKQLYFCLQIMTLLYTLMKKENKNLVRL